MFVAKQNLFFPRNQMDSIFLLNEVERATFLQHIIDSFSCTYICLWSYFPQHPYNCLLFMDGFYKEENNQPSSSSGSLARQLFDEYRQSIFMVENGHVPGVAFKNNLPYLELNELNLRSLATTKTQLQFYQEARIKSAIFMGCKTGEIELGLSNEAQVNMEMEMKKLFPEDFSRPRELTQPLDQNRPSSSSSSLRSLSMDSPERSPFLFNLPNTPYIQDPHIETHVQQAMRPISTTITTPPVQNVIHQALSQIRNIQFPTIESENAELTKAILAVLSSSSPSSSSSSQPHKASAFKSYRSSLAPTTQITTRKQNMLKRAVKFLTGLNLRRNQEQIQGSSARPSTTQLHHMISERRRREKLNESFQVLRSLLPPGTKRDKASVLTSTTEYLTSLKAQVEELSRRNQILEAQLPRKEPVDQEGSGSSSERLDVRVTDVGESTSDARIVDLQVIVRGECSMLDLVIRVMEFLKQDENVSLIMSIEAQPVVVDTNSMNRVVLRLKIEGAEWDKSAFREALKRVVDDLAQ